MSSNNNNNPRDIILSGEDNEEEFGQLFGDLYNYQPMFSVVMVDNPLNKELIFLVMKILHELLVEY